MLDPLYVRGLLKEHGYNVAQSDEIGKHTEIVVVDGELPLTRALERCRKLRKQAPIVLLLTEPSLEPEITVGDFVLRPLENRLQIGERRIELNRTQADLLYALMRNAGHIVPFDVLRAGLLRPRWRGRGSLAVHVRYLREKVEPEPSHPRHILTLRKRGYRFQP